MTRANTRMNTSATRKMRTFRRKARAMSGKDSRKTVGSKNPCLTSSHPAELTTTRTMTAMKSAVETRAMPTLLPPPPFVRLPRIFEPRFSFSGALLQVRRSSPRQVRPLETLDCPVRPQAVERPVHAPDERVALLEHHAEVLAHAALRQLPDDRPVVQLCSHYVEGRREIDDDAVDLARLERGDRVVVRVVDRGRLRGPDEPGVVVVTCGTELGAQLVRAQARDGLYPRDRSTGVGDDGLVHEVVRVRERHVLRALG